MGRGRSIYDEFHTEVDGGRAAPEPGPTFLCIPPFSALFVLMSCFSEFDANIPSVIEANPGRWPIRGKFVCITSPFYGYLCFSLSPPRSWRMHFYGSTLVKTTIDLPRIHHATAYYFVVHPDEPAIVFNVFLNEVPFHSIFAGE